MTLKAGLSAEHAELDTLARRMVQAVSSPDGPPDDFASIRWRLNHVLSVHLAKEDKHLYPALAKAASPVVQSTAKRFADEMGGLAAAHTAYVGKWPVTAIAADWHGFARDTRTVMGLLRQRITREDRELYPLLPDG